jgi:hypothetical protein
MKRLCIILICFLCLTGAFASGKKDKGFSKNGLFLVNGQEVFISGMNLAWMHFGRDITEFDRTMYLKALEEIALNGGNCIRWWIHVNGSTSPIYDEDDGKVLVLNPGFQANLEEALDLAWERGIMVVLCLWSFDMLKSNTGVNLEANLKMIEDPEYTMAYVNRALRPLVLNLKDHPAILCWEIINEPEGMLKTSGWSDLRTDMEHIQSFINLIAGGIHRADPDALVTVGSSLDLTCNIEGGGMINYFSDERLIAAGGDELGILDFYEAHYYPQHMDEVISPFHHPASYWELDKPILIGEFPAFGIREFGKGFKPKTSLSTEEAYLYAFQNGYAGALSWTWTAHDGFGGVEDAAEGMMPLKEQYPEYVVIQTGVNRPPMVTERIDKLILGLDVREVNDYISVKEHFIDHEDGTEMEYLVGEISNPDILSAEIDNEGNLDLFIPVGSSGVCRLEVIAQDSGGKQRGLEFMVFVFDPTKGNLALFKDATSSSIESELLAPEYAVDGLEDTRWSSAWVDNEWLMIDMGDVYTIDRFRLVWEVAFGLHYEIQVSDDRENWTTVYVEESSDGKTDEFTIQPVTARYVRMYGVKRATQWGFSLWEFEVYKAE